MTLRTGVEPMDGQPIVGVPIKRALPVLIYHIFDKKDDWSFTRCSKSLNNRYLFSSQRKLLQKFQCRLEKYFNVFEKKIGLAFNMEYLIPVLLLWTSICVTLVHSIDFPVSEKYSTCPKKCDLSKCNKLSYCGGTIIKDECGCCQICSSDTWIHPKVSSVKQGRSAVIWYYLLVGMLFRGLYFILCIVWQPATDKSKKNVFWVRNWQEYLWVYRQTMRLLVRLPETRPALKLPDSKRPPWVNFVTKK